MANYVIRVDSSTKPRKFGKSSAAWITFINNNIIAAGLIYYQTHGCNKTIYEGILAAFSQLETEHFYKGGYDKVKVYIDCKIVLDQLNGSPAKRMLKYLNRIKNFLSNHTNVAFEFLYQNEKDPEFKKVDIISKNGREWIQKFLKDQKINKKRNLPF